jgi:hypothetical protein
VFHPTHGHLLVSAIAHGSAAFRAGFGRRMVAVGADEERSSYIFALESMRGQADV